jgi:hypothetical protein
MPTFPFALALATLAFAARAAGNRSKARTAKLKIVAH